MKGQKGQKGQTGQGKDKEMTRNGQERKRKDKKGQ